MVGTKAVPRVTPWSCGAEWASARALVVARSPESLAMLRVWSSRTPRLPAGVEVTLGLLQAHLATPHTPLSLATAVNRFLNHISHLGLSLWSVSRLHEAAARLAVPEWLVELRHETTHGAMPSLVLLRAAVECGLAWLEQHYWREQEVEQANQRGEDRLEQLLELYKYLKVYQVWGTERVKEIREQGEMWQLLSDLWKDLELRQELSSLTVKQAVGLVKTDVVNLVKEEEEEGGLERLAKCLVQGELLVPDQEFLESLGEEDGKLGEVKVPKQLQQLWADLVGVVDRGVGAVVLVDRLMERVGEGEGGLLAGAWVVLLVEGMLGRSSGKVLSLAQCKVEEVRLERWLATPGPVVAQLTGLLCDLAGVEEGRRKRMEQLVRLASSPPEGRTGREAKIHKVGELVGKEELEEEVVGSKGWQVDAVHSWERMSLGGLEGQDWEQLWVEGEWQQEREEEQEQVPHFEIGSIDWSTASGMNRRGEGKRQKAEDQTPHFYSPGVQQQQHAWKRQKRN